MSTLPGTWREPHRDVEFPFPVAVKEWAEAAVPVLEDVASTYGGYITSSDLATRLFDSTGIRTRMMLPNFSGRLLNQLIRICNEQDLPALSALVVNATDGSVGSGFDEVLRSTGREVPTTDVDRERMATAERLGCYRLYCADLPDDAEPRLTAKYEQRIRPAKELLRPKPVCAAHGIQLPATGVCDDCAYRQGGRGRENVLSAEVFLCSRPSTPQKFSGSCHRKSPRC